MTDPDTDPVLAEMQKQTDHLRAIRTMVGWIIVIALAVILGAAVIALIVNGSSDNGY